MEVDQYMKLAKLVIENNPILGNISLDFRDKKGNVVDNIIFAGENGSGKTTILNIIARNHKSERIIPNEKRELTFLVSEEECRELRKLHSWISSDFECFKTTYKGTINGEYEFSCALYKNIDSRMPITHTGYHFSKIVYLTPEIQFNSRPIEHVTSLDLDTNAEQLTVSNQHIADQITQLLIDIYNQDSSDFARVYEQNPSGKYSGDEIHPRISRFNNAFKCILSNFSISHIENNGNHKNVMINNCGKMVNITNLSSGEKQLLFRGGFLLKDKKAFEGSVVLIDEPEISLHPEWQKQILSFYREILTNTEGKQTSQLFIATHSPFIVHSPRRINDKVFVLKKENGSTKVLEKSEYYSITDPTSVRDAFNLNDFIYDDYTVFVEGRTDEKYFNKAIEVFKIKTKLKFKWIGYIDDDKTEKNSGLSALNNALNFLLAQNDGKHVVLLYDCDANKQKTLKNNVLVLSLPTYKNTKKMNKGIENALILDSVDTEGFYNTYTHEKDYGNLHTDRTLDKVALCEYICKLQNLETVLKHLKEAIEQIQKEIGEKSEDR